MSDRFNTCSRLKYLGYHEWVKHPHPNKFYFSSQYDIVNCLCHFDRTKYQVRCSKKHNEVVELVNIADGSVFVSIEIYLSYNWIEKRYTLGL